MKKYIIISFKIIIIYIFIYENVWLYLKNLYAILRNALLLKALPRNNWVPYIPQTIEQQPYRILHYKERKKKFRLIGTNQLFLKFFSHFVMIVELYLIKYLKIRIYN